MKIDEPRKQFVSFCAEKRELTQGLLGGDQRRGDGCLNLPNHWGGGFVKKRSPEEKREWYKRPASFFARRKRNAPSKSDSINALYK